MTSTQIPPRDHDAARDAGYALHSAFINIQIISRPDRQDRRERMRRQLAHFGLHVGRPPGLEFFDAIQPPSADGFPSAARRGCFLSHVAIARRALAERWERVLILEDDCRFSPAF